MAREASGITTQQLCDHWKCSNGDLANVTKGRHKSERLESLIDQFIRDNWHLVLEVEKV